MKLRTLTVEKSISSTEHTLDVVLSALQAWPHWEEIGAVAKKEYGLSEERYNELLPEYQRFMALIILGHHGLGMFSAAIDQIWHSHILSTHCYEDFCMKLHGQMIHHIPQLTAKAQNMCTVCQSCKGCNARCENCQANCKSGEAPSHDSAEYFRDAYTVAYGRLPDSLWNLPVADGTTA
jgi:hypothetical protein